MFLLSHQQIYYGLLYFTENLYFKWWNGWPATIADAAARYRYHTSKIFEAAYIFLAHHITC
jgi:hypothetical protein